MRLTKLIFSCVSIFLITVFSLQGQLPTIQDCLGAIPVCQEIYVETTAPSGSGNYPNELNPGFTCIANEQNAIWYTFTTNSSGNFGFVVTPNNLNDDYDWALYNITNATCEDIKSDASLLISCNAAGGNPCHGQTGATGGTIYNIQGGGCGTDPPSENSGFRPENDLVSVQANNTYVLMVANWSSTLDGYTIDFGISDVDIFDFRKPELLNDDFPETCTGDQIILSFDENILCSSLALGNFMLIGPTVTHNLTASSPLCSSGSLYDKEFILTADPPITESGFYTLSFCCLSDACGNELDPVVLNYNVTLLTEPTVDFGPDQILCDGESIILDATNEAAQYDWNSGQITPTIQVTQSGTYLVNVSNACGTANDVVLIEFISEPSFDFAPIEELCTGETLLLDATSDNATYIWSTNETSSSINVTSNGQYSVTATNQCGELIDQTDVNYTDLPQVDLGPDQFLCQGESIQLVADFPGATVTWQDGSNDPTLQVSATGVYSVVVSNSCGQAIDDINVTYIDTPNFELGPEQFPCDGEVITLTASGDNATFNWSNGQSTPSINVTSTGLYTVTAENQCGNFTDEVQVNFSADVNVDFGPSKYLCDPIILRAADNYDFADYTWQDGSKGQEFVVTQAGTYWLELSSDCKMARDTVDVFDCEECNVYFPNIFSPNSDGMNDEFIISTPCIFDKYDLVIYDRWGNLVFQSDDVNSSWNGKMKDSYLTPGVYPYFLDYELTLNGIREERKKTGTITLLSY